jgi:Domain of unknown function (DUF4136)
MVGRQCGRNKTW